MEPIWKGKQTNKQVEAAHVEAQMQGVVQSCVTCRVQYTMHQSMWKSFRDALEKCRVQYAGSYSDMLFPLSYLPHLTTTGFHIFVGGLLLTWHLTREPYTSPPSPFETNPWSSKGVQEVLLLVMNNRALWGFEPNTTLIHQM